MVPFFVCLFHCVFVHSFLFQVKDCCRYFGWNLSIKNQTLFVLLRFPWEFANTQSWWESSYRTASKYREVMLFIHFFLKFFLSISLFYYFILVTSLLDSSIFNSKLRGSSRKMLTAYSNGLFDKLLSFCKFLCLISACSLPCSVWFLLLFLRLLLMYIFMLIL